MRNGPHFYLTFHTLFQAQRSGGHPDLDLHAVVCNVYTYDSSFGWMYFVQVQVPPMSKVFASS